MVSNFVYRWTALLLGAVALSGCFSAASEGEPPQPPPQAQPVSLQQQESLATMLDQSWVAYQEWFIQGDGRVIDREDADRSTSEGQAYAMLRAVLIDDPETFEQTFQWAENNLQRADGSQGQLWSWRWGQDDGGTWRILDANFATDADIDAIAALILAARRWKRPDYQAAAQEKLVDLWTYATLAAPGTGNQPRYLLPGPRSAFEKDNKIYLNPSYFAPYAFRLFAQVDPQRDWLSLVDSSYAVLNQLSDIAVLPPDWITLTLTTGELGLSENDSLRSVYSFDAYRVWWRIRLDDWWFDEPRARDYLSAQLPVLTQLWQSQGKIPARIDSEGKPTVEYESTAQYAMLYLGFQGVDSGAVERILQEKLAPAYENGFWDNRSAYYVQNLGWFAIYDFQSFNRLWLNNRS